MTTTPFDAVPFELTPSPGSTWTVGASGHEIKVDALPHSDIFVDPAGAGVSNAATLMNAVTLLGAPPEGDFRLSARVTVDFRSTFDAGTLMLWWSEQYWAKLCFEYSPDGDAMVVSVVNRLVADDANSFAVDGDQVWLRVSRVGDVFAYHASTDGATWSFVRVFVVDAAGLSPRVGFEAQSPTGEGCRVTFDEVAFDTVSLTDLRDGS
ncbi:DUF1349 domain-containing protein [Demequina aestuarii]|uniref:DUF1349 domain-containing protein n=1 Tax=Demequina aestuarii TaxID=327095 RepID=UPI00078146D4|nr:DUF1349 domain-containing protein [Demequina aestuarii]